MHRLLREVTADTLALIIFSLATGIIGLWFERSVAGLSLVQMAGVRVGYNIVKYVFAEVCAEIADGLRTRLLGNSTHPFRRALADGLALSGYQIPLYVGCALSARVAMAKVGLMTTFFLANNLSLGWLYGIILNWIRQRLAVRTNGLT